MLNMRVAVLLAASSSFTLASYVSSMPKNARGLFKESMAWMDTLYDPAAGYLYETGSASALRHETRSSGWYAVGLLARNGPGDVHEADKIITNIVHGQYNKDPLQYWFAEYQQEPEEPEVGSVYYPAEIYHSFDGNWRYDMCSGVDFTQNTYLCLLAPSWQPRSSSGSRSFHTLSATKQQT